MAQRDQHEMARARQARLVGVVMGVAIVVWVVGQWVGGQMGWDPRYAFLLDFAALAAFVWGLLVAARLWRARRNERTDHGTGH